MRVFIVSPHLLLRQNLKKFQFWVDKVHKNILFPDETGRIPGKMVFLLFS